MPEVDYKKPAIVGGLIVGILSILPYINLANCIFCLWAIVGGVVAARLLITRSETPLVSRDGAWIGLLAGIIGGAIFFVVIAPVTLWQMDSVLQTLSTDTRIPPDIQSFYMQVAQSPALKMTLSIGGVFFGSLLILGFTVIGGMIGVSLFEKRKVQAWTPTPPDPYDPSV